MQSVQAIPIAYRYRILSFAYAIAILVYLGTDRSRCGIDMLGTCICKYQTERQKVEKFGGGDNIAARIKNRGKKQRINEPNPVVSKSRNTRVLSPIFTYNTQNVQSECTYI